ncbi:MAG: hypothetical protein ACREFE_14565, partial [Limisphaerales bacterium]
MHISKLIPVICAVAFYINFSPARADDTSAQAAAARAALLKAMNEGAPQTNPPATRPEQVKTPLPVVTTPVQPETKPEIETQKNATITPEDTAEQAAAARAALLKAMNEGAPQTHPPATQPEQVKTPLPVVTTPVQPETKPEIETQKNATITPEDTA